MSLVAKYRDPHNENMCHSIPGTKNRFLSTFTVSNHFGKMVVLNLISRHRWMSWTEAKSCDFDIGNKTLISDLRMTEESTAIMWYLTTLGKGGVLVISRSFMISQNLLQDLKNEQSVVKESAHSIESNSDINALEQRRYFILDSRTPFPWQSNASEI